MNPRCPSCGELSHVCSGYPKFEPLQYICDNCETTFNFEGRAKVNFWRRPNHDFLESMTYAEYRKVVKTFLSAGSVSR